MDLMRNEDRYNSNFKKYVDDYCAKNGCELEDAFKDKSVKQMFWRVTEL